MLWSDLVSFGVSQRTSSGCTRIGTYSFRLWCDERKKNEKLKVRNMTWFGVSIYILSGSSEIGADTGSA